ncbi:MULTISPECIES: NADH:flavin oxidoreductase/NADH oxidase [Pantoea]|jgi:2,4-dienoyl-CoA reductase-like NADH-dependent reductase (Old Yellow Enzyme family)|uniref:NADH:flavin oxidoreductase/NADH oxidase n=1 Tax=Pantoea eucrina TaxID=472693 RepID=A0ABS1Z537_9GAMM|nr:MULTISPECIES: NADH:flavin oxidoreductase/NADH oxidase [Pantoea]QNH52947.1 NADH:flavin oxidoreductase/NADH oxidase [Acinetobacter venetianus]AJA71023.1 oxidoreductase [Pantoea sp. PSNIH1]MBM0747524.1 NADH:flavin oxidoreductase/NADH oxidase [Pantoea eucrina]MDJ0023550.1 NADH:flavin oxidoreductase/NADH oxidase [Pantoea eucrina]OIX98164.1 oxidoreductase [Pantoea sp. Ae16]
MSLLFSATKLGQLSLENRIIIAPMCQYSAEAGKATAWHRIHLGQLALSGAGLLIIEATAVEDIGRISPGDLGLWDDETEAALASVLEDIRPWATLPIGIQLGHAGRKASCAVPWEGGEQLSAQQGGWQTVAPSAEAYQSGEQAPHALSKEELMRLKQAFVDSAQRAVRIGIELVELHAAHGYLLHQFLSPLSNKRDDEYGGSLENRMRYPLEVFQAIRDALPDSVPVGVRISATDWVAGGWDNEQSIAFSQQLAAAGCAYIHVSSGGLSPDQEIDIGPGYQLSFARDIRKVVDIPVIGVGLITDPQQAEQALHTGDTDLIALARGMLWDPHWPWHAAAELGATVKAPPQYLRSEPHGLKGTLVQNGK